MLKTEGQLAYVRTRIVGFKRRSLTLRWSIYNARTQRRRPANLANATGAEIVGQAPSDDSVSLVWTPMVVDRGQYFARFEIVDPTASSSLLPTARSSRA